MSIDINLIKGRDGWEARSRLPLFDNMMLKIRTHKASEKGWLATYVSAVCVEGDGFETHRIFKDFNIVANKTTGRATEKSILELHENTLGYLDDIKAQALAHYAKEREHESA